MSIFYTYDANTIILKPREAVGRRYEEAWVAAGAAPIPGHLLMFHSDGKVKEHNVRGGRTSKMVAVEDALSGYKTIDTAYAAGKLCRYNILNTGDLARLRLKIGESVSVGDIAVSGGDGSVVKAASLFLSNPVAASDAISNTTTETAFSNGSVTLPANSLKVGDVLRFRAQGIATATNSTDTLTVKLKIGTTVIATTGAVDVANNDIFLIDVTLVIRTIGASGTFVATGTVSLGAGGTVTSKAIYLASTAIDTTAAQTVTVTATWSVASSSNSVRQDVFTVEKVEANSASIGSAAGQEPVGVFQEAKDNSAGSAAALVPVLFY